MTNSIEKQLFYFGDLEFLLKQEYFKDKLTYKHFLEFIENLKNKELQTNEVVQFQYQDLTGTNTPILLSKTINTDYVCCIDKPQQILIENYNFSEIECNIKSKSGLFGLLCVSSVIDNVKQLIQDLSKEQIGLIFSINNNVDFYKNNLDYKVTTFDTDAETYCHICKQSEFVNRQQNLDCKDCDHSIVSYHYQIYAHEIKFNNKRLFMINN